MGVSLFSIPLLAWGGTFLLLAGEILALLHIRNLVKLLLFSTIAEIGFVLLGFGLDNQSGVTGALMHTLGRTGRIDRLSGGLCKSEDFAAVKDRMASFMAAGFVALCGKSRKSSGSRAKSSR